jgi:hypothetical protein
MLRQSITLILAKSSTMAFAFLNSLFILQFVNEDIRGYFFTFSSIAAFTSIFELGIGTVIGQFLAHESAHFKVKKKEILGDNKHISRFFDILRTALFWYSKVFSVGFLIVFVIGFGIFFSKNQDYIPWMFPWLIFLTFTLLNILLELIFNAIYVTIGVNKPQVLKAVILTVSFLCSWGLIIVDNKNSLLYLVIIPMLTFILNLGLGIIYFPQVFLNILPKVQSSFSWKSEVFDLQKKIAVSYASGAFIYNLFTPTMFYFHGSEAAARIGISLQFAAAVPSIVNYLISIQSLKLGALFGANMTLEAINIFKKILKIALGILILGLLGVASIYFFKLSQKLVSMPELLLLYFSYSINSIVHLMANFIRSQKKEYFSVFSFVFAFINTLVIFAATYFFSSLGQTVGFFLVNILVSLPWSFLIFHADFKNLKERKYVPA